MKKKKESVELRFYEVPQNEAALTLTGESWVRVYGHDELNKYGEPKLHFHNLMEIGYCRQGLGEIYLDNKIEHYETGNITIIPENYPHVTLSDGEGTNFWEYIFFDPKKVVTDLYPNNPNAVRDIILQMNRGAIFTETKAVPALARVIEAVLDEGREKKPYSTRLQHIYIKALVIELMRINEEIPYYPYKTGKKNAMEQIAIAVEYVEKHYMESIKVQDVSKACNMSETHFRRTFEEHINMAPADYINLVRVQKACELLKNTNDSMDGIAMKCGFSNTSTLNRNFKKYLAISPYQWKISPETGKRLMNYNVSVLKGW